MAYDEALAERVRQRLAQRKGIVARKMFGGVGFMLNGNIVVGVWKDSLIVRLSPDRSEEALLEPHVRVFDITGKPMRGWVLVDPEGLATDDQLDDWLRQALNFIKTLVPRRPSGVRRPRSARN
jgi:TfoX/Sxy family transcriptional regulator of competence genes